MYWPSLANAVLLISLAFFRAESVELHCQALADAYL